jgi:hypothetical protein
LVAARSPWRVLIGALIALVLPISYWGVAQLVQVGIVPFDFVHPLLGTFTVLSFAELLLGPLGLYVAGHGAGVRGFHWLLVFFFGIAALALIFIDCMFALSGALGEPF